MAQGVTLNTTPPSVEGPPNEVVPYRFPAESRTKRASGSMPSEYEKLWRTVTLQAVSSLNIVP